MVKIQANSCDIIAIDTRAGFKEKLGEWSYTRKSKTVNCYYTKESSMPGRPKNPFI